MIDAIVVNHWRCEQARTVVKPFIAKYKSDNNVQLPMVQKIHRETYKLSIQDHVHKLGIGIRLLQALKVDSFQAALLTRSIATTTQHANVAASLPSATDAKTEIDQIIGRRKRK